MCVNVCACVYVCVLAWPALHCKSKSSDDIINNVLETDGRSLCFGLCFHSTGNQSLHKLLSLIKPQADTLIQRVLLYLRSHYHMRGALPWGHIVKTTKCE